MGMGYFWPLSPFIEYITEVPFGPFKEGDKIKLIEGVYAHYEDGYSYTFKRTFPFPDITFTEKHPGEFKANLYYLDFLKPASALPGADSWSFPQSPDELAYIDTTAFKNKKPILFVFHDEGAWRFLSNESSQELVAMRLGDIVYMDQSILKTSNLPEGFWIQRPSLKSEWSSPQKKS